MPSSRQRSAPTRYEAVLNKTPRKVKKKKITTKERLQRTRKRYEAKLEVDPNAEMPLSLIWGLGKSRKNAYGSGFMKASALHKDNQKVERFANILSNPKLTKKILKRIRAKTIGDLTEKDLAFQEAAAIADQRKMGKVIQDRKQTMRRQSHIVERNAPPEILKYPIGWDKSPKKTYVKDFANREAVQTKAGPVAVLWHPNDYKDMMKKRKCTVKELRETAKQKGNVKGYYKMKKAELLRHVACGS